jgi:hypothetical protein
MIRSFSHRLNGWFGWRGIANAYLLNSYIIFESPNCPCLYIDFPAFDQLTIKLKQVVGGLEAVKIWWSNNICQLKSCSASFKQRQERWMCK